VTQQRSAVLSGLTATASVFDEYAKLDSFYTDSDLLPPLIRSSYNAVLGYVAYFLTDAKMNGRTSVLIDVGTASATLIEMALELFPDAQCIGVEPSEQMTLFARKKFDSGLGYGNVSILQGTAQELPEMVSEGSASVVTMHNAAHYLSDEDLSRAIGHFRSVSAESGGLVMTLFKPDYDFRSLLQANIGYMEDTSRRWLAMQLNPSREIISLVNAVSDVVSRVQRGQLDFAGFTDRLNGLLSLTGKDHESALPVRLIRSAINALPLEQQLTPNIYRHAVERLQEMLQPYYQIKEFRRNHYSGTQHFVVGVAL